MSTKGHERKRPLEKSPYTKREAEGVRGGGIARDLARARELRSRMLAGEQIDHCEGRPKIQAKDPRAHKKPASKATGFHRDMPRFTEACATRRSHW
jgi:hypothetical protein